MVVNIDEEIPLNVGTDVNTESSAADNLSSGSLSTGVASTSNDGSSRIPAETISTVKIDKTVKAGDEKKTPLKQVIAYEKLISQRDIEILTLRRGITELQEKLSVKERENQCATECCKESARWKTELEYMHDENDRIRAEMTKEKENLRSELEILKNKSDENQEQMASKHQELETQLVCEKGKNLTISQKLDDAVLLSERTLMAYNSQKDLAIAKQELIDNLKREIATSMQHSAGIMTSNSTMPVTTDQDTHSKATRDKIAEISNHYDGKIQLLTEEIDLLKVKLKDANNELNEKNLRIQQLETRLGCNAKPSDAKSEKVYHSAWTPISVQI